MRRRIWLKIVMLCGMSILPQLGCFTGAQFEAFLAAELALLGTRLIADPVTNEIEELAGPQIVEEVVPSL